MALGAYQLLIHQQTTPLALFAQLFLLITPSINSIIIPINSALIRFLLVHAVSLGSL